MNTCGPTHTFTHWTYTINNIKPSCRPVFWSLGAVGPENFNGRSTQNWVQNKGTCLLVQLVLTNPNWFVSRDSREMGDVSHSWAVSTQQRRVTGGKTVSTSVSLHSFRLLLQVTNKLISGPRVVDLDDTNLKAPHKTMTLPQFFATSRLSLLQRAQH